MTASSFDPSGLDAQLIPLALDLADAAGEVIRPLFRGELHAEYKPAASPIVTIADRQAEQRMRQILSERVPHHGVIGEEFGRKEADSPYTWVLDPLDGTIGFSTGKPLFGTLIALLLEDQPILGIIDQPIWRERWLGIRGRVTTYNGQPVQSKANRDLRKAYLSTTSPDLFATPDQKRYLHQLRQVVSVTSFGGDCYQYGLLALGCLDVILERSLALYDFAALIPVIEGAGGVITDWQGSPLHQGSPGEVLATANPQLHQQVLQLWSASPVEEI
ncbi:MAG: histidinol-phosphatase [Cyanobacteriota bacterium]|nr:histidinol-phosphatase [Cyanobacteriota bacterium]